MDNLEMIFWILALLLFYTYVGYGVLLYLLVRMKELVFKPKEKELPVDLPQVTLLIAAYNEQDVVDDKMQNCNELEYPTEKLKIVWVTDGSSDSTNKLLANHSNVEVLFDPIRAGKSAAINRAMPFVASEITIFTDANTMLCKEAILEMIREFTDPKVGCVAGEKRVVSDGDDATAGEGIYWKYESFLKMLDYRLYSAVGAAGELFAIRTNLYESLSSDTILDDFILSLKIAMRGSKIAYCKRAYAIEKGSASIREEKKRKVRIAAGGLQSIARLWKLFNVFKYGVLSFQYVSHRVLRWSVAPVALFALLPLNFVLLFNDCVVYKLFFVMQMVIYLLAYYGKNNENKIAMICYYFIFMNANVIEAFSYFKKNKGKGGVWEKAARKE